MNQSTEIASPTARFSEAVRAFTPVCASRYAKLLPFKDGIVELRQKGASYRLIRELLATADVAVAVDTIGNFVREVIEQRAAARLNPRRRAVRPLSEPSAARALPTPSRPQFPFTVAPPVEAAPEAATPIAPPATVSAPAVERSRTRGPRIADPSNL
jgi:hypothetical protein